MARPCEAEQKAWRWGGMFGWVAESQMGKALGSLMLLAAAWVRRMPVRSFREKGRARIEVYVYS